LPDDVLTDLLVVGAEPREILLIEEMAEGAMPDIVQESGESKQFFDIVRRRAIDFVNRG
jgi:hypothetical protein